MNVPQTWTAKASVLLVPPPTVVGEDGNPYLYLGGLGQALDVLTRRLDAEAVRGPLEDTYPDAEYTVTVDGNSTGPILLIEAEAEAGPDALALVKSIHSQIPQELLGMQADLNVPRNALITASDITVDVNAESDNKRRIQLTGLVAAGGLALTVLLAGIVDGLVNKRRKRSKSPEHAETAESLAVWAQENASTAPHRESLKS
ncbi:hypothetical protein SAMN04489834_0818 [Microterricola viridarii]|uniref:Uncharacterized protein n=2 Tax=Microterricola viridarii TaxID=412690 RepID=A0A1H1P9B8_9MICO|nr:hypothetical protein SAMN04489834_0818 [Microterricola viridarii]